VYGNGEDFRTGSAAGPGSLDTLKADKVNPWGPGSVDYFRLVSAAQGTLGLVSWAITKVEVLPSIHQLYFIPVKEAKTATDVMNQLLRRRVADECLALNNVNLAAILAENWPGDFIELKNKLPPWMVLVCISGYRLRPEERIDIQKQYLMEICQNLGIKATTGLCGAEGREADMLELLTNPWLKEPYWKLRNKGGCQDIFFLSALSQASGFSKVMQQLAQQYGYAQENIGGYIQPVVQGRGCHCEFNLFYDKADQTKKAEVQRLWIDASKTLMQQGAFFSRPYGVWADMVYSDNALEVASLKKLKKIFDPHNILNPGKLCF
jgi:hypothetical protein